MTTLLEYLSTNKDWIFSGIGVVLLFTLLPATIKYFWPKVRRSQGEAEGVSLNEKDDQRNRKAIITNVKNYWIKGVLEKSLHNAVLIDLGLEQRPEAIVYPWDQVVQRSDQETYTLPPGTKIADVFEEVGRALLILGKPGSGKTTMLLDLARDLIHQAEENDTQPIPVVFNLSSWTNPQQSIADWLVDELHTKYLVPKKVARRWVENDDLLLLLDGLDELALERREACVQAINDFRQATTQIVVCSRIADYEALTTKLKLPGAVLLQPLTSQQIDEYLNSLELVEALLIEEGRDKELRCFCYDTPGFEPVYNQFALRVRVKKMLSSC